MTPEEAARTGIDTNTRNIYRKISGMKNNPTRNSINPKMQELLGRVGSSQTNYPLDNCAEFNIIKNAINDGVGPRNLRVYTINIAIGSYKAPCINCQNLYGDIGIL